MKYHILLFFFIFLINFILFRIFSTDSTLVDLLIILELIIAVLWGLGSMEAYNYIVKIISKKVVSRKTNIAITPADKDQKKAFAITLIVMGLVSAALIISGFYDPLTDLFSFDFSF